MIGRHSHANMKVQTATCKDNNNSKRRVATCLKCEINYKMILVHYIQCMKYPIFKISFEFQDVKVHQC